jgi:hypothetical protein
MATTTTATIPSGIFSDINLRNIDFDDLVKFSKMIGKRTALLSPFITTQAGDATLDNMTMEEMISAFGQDVKTKGGQTVIGPDADDIQRAREEEAARLRGQVNQPPPKIDDGIILKGPDPADLEGLTGFPPVDPYPPLEKPEPVGGGFGADLPPKTLDDYIITMANERGSIEANKKRAEQQNKAREIAGQKAKEIFEKNSDKPFYSENPNIESIFDIISRETGYKSKNTIIKMLKEQNVDYTTAIKVGGFKPENFSDIVKESKDKTTKEYKDSVAPQVIEIYNANKDLPFRSFKEDVPSIIKIMQENVPSYQEGKKISIPTVKEILIEADIYEHGRDGEPRKDVALELSKISKEKLTEFSAMFERGLNVKEFPTIEKLDEFFTSQGIDLKDLNELLSDNPQKFNDLEKTRLKAQEILLDLTSDFNIALATQVENYDVNGNFMPIKLAKMHPSETLRPIKDEDQFRSIDIENVRIGGSTVNTVVQPEHGKALARYIKNEDVENTKRIIEVLKEYHILTNLNDMLDEKDYKWLEENKIVEIPKISYKGEEFVNYDAVVFGAKDTPSIEQVIEAELKARKNFGLRYSVFQEMKDKGEKLPAFNTYLRDGGIVGMNYMTRPLNA